MNIAFDAQPLISGRMSGIGYCEAGQVTRIMDMYPENSYQFQYFSLRNHDIKKQRISQYMRQNTKINVSGYSGFLYRLFPLPYSAFFGKSADITHFFNYIVPPCVHGKTVVTVHDMVIKAYPETVRLRTRKMLELGLEKSMKRADTIVTDSEFSRSEIEKYYPQFASKVCVVPCGVDSSRFYPEKNQSEIQRVKDKNHINDRYFLYLGTVEPRKNLERLIKAYNIFKKSYNNPPQLVMAGGNGWLNSSIYSLGTECGVKFTEYIPSEDLRPLICGADAFLFPSVYEGFGMPPLEAMACGVPVLVSSSASLPEVVGNCAVITDAYSEKSIAEGIDRLYSDRLLCRELSEKGIVHSRKYSWEKSAEKLYQVYCRTVGTGE